MELIENDGYPSCEISSSFFRSVIRLLIFEGHGYFVVFDLPLGFIKKFMVFLIYFVVSYFLLDFVGCYLCFVVFYLWTFMYYVDFFEAHIYKTSRIIQNNNDK